MSKIDYYFSSYNKYHKSDGNKLTHYVGIPLIVFSTFGLLAVVRWQWIDLGWIVWLLSSVFYCRLDWKRGLPFSLLTFVLYWCSKWVPIEIHWVSFIVGWILQGVGHYIYEKKSPAFLTNISHLLIGPFWIFCRLIPSP